MAAARAVALLACIAAAGADEVEVVVVGAGYSGLAAARELKRHGVTFRVLEAQQRVGGRTLNQVVVGDSPDDVVEMGGEWLATGHRAALRLFKDLGFELFHRPFNFKLEGGTARGADPPCRGSCPIRVRTSKGWRNASSPAKAEQLLPAEEKERLQRAKADIFQQVLRTPCKAPFSNPNASKWDSLSYDAYLKLVLGLVDAPMAYNILYGYADDAEALAQISALSVIWSLNCSGSLEGSDEEDYWRVRGGSQGPAKRQAELLGGALWLGARVVAVHRGPDGRYEVHSSGGLVQASHVIFAGLTPSLLTAIDFQPPLEGAVDQLFQRAPMGTSMKYSMVYKRPWWRERGYLGRIIFLNTSAPENYVHTCLDNSPYSWVRGVLTCFTEGAQNRAFSRLSPPQRRSAMRRIVEEALGSPDGEEVVEILEKNWADDEFSRGAYNVFFPPGVLSSFWPEVYHIFEERRLGPPGLWIAGADYSLTSEGYMNGAIETGEVAAQKVVQELRGAGGQQTFAEVLV